MMTATLNSFGLALRRLVRPRYVDRNHKTGRIDEMRFSWGSISFRTWALGFGAMTDADDGGHISLHLPWLAVYVHVSNAVAARCKRWHLRATREALHYGRNSVMRWPWEWDWQTTELLDFDRNVVAIERKGGPRFWDIARRDSFDEHRALIATVSQTFPYRYMLQNGEVQERQATVHVERRTWRRRCFPFLRRSVTTIEVAFDGEVGERTGSWKGGCVGCGQELWWGETPRESLRRMEQTRRFR